MKLLQVGLVRLVLIILCCGNLMAQPRDEAQDAGASSGSSKKKAFEGSIRFVQETSTDTSFYTYHVSGTKVRMDIHSGCKDCDGQINQLLFDLKDGTIVALHPERKLYMNLNVRPYIETADSNFYINRTRNNKKIMGYKCYQWRVRNKEQNTEIAYWVAEDDFDFFDDFLRLWNRTEKHASYFLKIPDTNGFFPMLSVERTSLRDEKMRLQVIEINKTELSDDFFQIPADFKPYDR